MKTVTVNAEDLIREVKWMSRLKDTTAPTSNIMQVRILLGALQLRRTDLDQYRESLIVGRGADQSCIEVDTGLVMDVIKLHRRDQALVGIDEDRLVIQVGGQVIRVKGVTPGEFPEWPVFERDKERSAAVGARKLTRAMTSLASDDLLPVLTNVAFDNGAMYTTDRFRMTRVLYDTGGFTALVPATALRAFSAGDGMAIIATGTGSVAKQTDIPMVRVSSGGRSAVVRIPDGEFPNVERLIPESPTTRVTLHREALLAAASGHRTVLKLDGTDLTAIGSDDKGDVEIEKSIKVTPLGESAPFTTTLMTKYLTDCLKAMNSGTVLFEATEPDKPLAFSDADQSTVHLVMPIRPSS
jgi:DNA polymerase III sliding clamp (beta) subunit (PCNA family)